MTDDRDKPARPPVDVVAAIVQRRDGRVLLAERPAGKPWAGYWEFPGGKIEPDESAEVALRRELHEELGIDATATRPWITFVHDYPEKTVRLHFYRVPGWTGQPHGREGQTLAWENPNAVAVRPLLPANDRVVAALNLPSVYAITQASRYGAESFLNRLDAALARGVRLVQVREKDMTPDERLTFARSVVARAHAAGARVLVNNDRTLARETGADGVHWPAARLASLTPAPADEFWGASCHDESELAMAARLGAGFAVLSPVLPTASHPDAPTLGWERFAKLVRHCPIPVYALGGMTPDLLDTAWQHGAHGIAMLSGIWSPD